jgi:hypothetical protein
MVLHLHLQTGALLAVLPTITSGELPAELLLELSFPLHAQSRIFATLPASPWPMMLLRMNVLALIDFAFRQTRIRSPAEQWLETSLGFRKAVVAQEIQ